MPHLGKLLGRDGVLPTGDPFIGLELPGQILFGTSEAFATGHEALLQIAAGITMMLHHLSRWHRHRAECFRFRDLRLEQPQLTLDSRLGFPYLAFRNLDPSSQVAAFARCLEDRRQFCHVNRTSHGCQLLRCLTRTSLGRFQERIFRVGSDLVRQPADEVADLTAHLRQHRTKLGRILREALEIAQSILPTGQQRLLA